MKPNVEHAIGFVDDEDFDAVEQDLATLGEIEQAAGGGDQHVGAAGDLGFLIAERNAADQQREIELMVNAIFAEGFLDLGGEFASRLEDQRARHARPGSSLFQHGQHRQREGRRLAGSGLGDAQDVAPLKRIGNGLFLDRRRRVVAGRFDGVEHFLAQAEFIEFHLGSHLEKRRCRPPSRAAQRSAQCAGSVFTLRARPEL